MNGMTSIRQGFYGHRQAKIGTVERCCVILILLFYTVTFSGSSDSHSSHLLASVSQIVCYVFIAPYLVCRWRIILGILSRDWLVCALLILALASTVWSVCPVPTLKSSVQLFATTLVGIYLGIRFRFSDQVRTIALMLIIAAGLSFLCVAFFPKLGLMQVDPPGWRGVFGQRNVLARAMVLGSLTCVLWARLRGTNRGASLMGFALCALLIILSKSATGLIVFCILFPFIVWTEAIIDPLMRHKYTALATLGLMIFAAVRYVPDKWVDWTDALGRDPTLTGRLPLWGLVLSHVLQHPWLGYGYAAFWDDDSGYVGPIQTLLRWDVPNGHNGYLDQTLDLGVIGLGLFIALYGSTLWRAVKIFSSSRSTAAVWPLFFVTFLFLCNLDETCMVQHSSYMWAMFIAVRVGLAGNSSLREESPSPSRACRQSAVVNHFESKAEAN